MTNTSYHPLAIPPIARTTGMQRRAQARQSQRGLSLIELMIAMVISLMTVLAITALISNQARQQRLGGSINDAQNNAMVAVSTIEKDLQQAGVGMAGNSLQNCNRFFTSINTGSVATELLNFNMMAVSIVDGAGTLADTVRVRYAESVRGEQPLPLVADMADAVADVKVGPNSSYAVRVNDLMLLTNNANDCTLAQVSATPTSSAGPPAHTLLSTAPVASPTAAAPNFNPATSPGGAWDTVAYTTANLTQAIILGQFTQRSYTVNTDVNNKAAALEVRVQGSANSGDTPVPVVENVVDLQAQYGISIDAASDTVTEWVSATGIWATPGTANRKRIRAIRFAVVARTGERDAGKPTPAAAITLWPEATTGQLSAAQTYTVAAGDPQEFRYRVLRMVVPLKNMLWSEMS